MHAEFKGYMHDTCRLYAGFHMMILWPGDGLSDLDRALHRQKRWLHLVLLQHLTRLDPRPSRRLEIEPR